MKNFINTLLGLKWSFLSLLLIGLVFISSCKKDVDPPVGDDPIASFQYEISADNFLEVSFSNFSQNATSYAWDFGDGNNSTEENPVHAYAAAGTYSVSLTATGADGTTPGVKPETITLTDPNEQLTLLAGTSSKKWFLNRGGIALGIGPNPDDNAWWSFGGVTPLGDRPCVLDDYFVFHRDGTFELNTAGTVFVDSYGNGGWLDTEACVDASETDKLVGENGEDLSVFTAGGNYNYTYEPSTNSLSVLGEGAYIGLPNKTNGGDNYVPVPTKDYYVFKFVDGADVDTMGLALIGDGFSWNFYLVSYENESDLPDIPTALPTANFSFSKEGNVVTFNNTSKNAASYAWDFGDGGSSTDENPVYTYAADGDYTVTLTVSDNNGNTDEIAQVVSISSAVFTSDILSAADGKTWKLAGVASFYVGPSEGSNEWWPGITEADLDGRACMLDDEFIFFDNGDFVYDSKGSVFAETYMGFDNICVNEGDLAAPFNGFGSGNHNFEATDATLKVLGTGAFVGFNKAFNGGEYNGSETELMSELTYNVFDYATDDQKETIWLTIDISADMSGVSWWTIVLESAK